MAGAMKASLNNAAYLFAAPLAQAVRAVDALRQKVAEGAPAEVAAPEDTTPQDTQDETPQDTSAESNEG
jgi:large subunit ribosomal protein L10